MKDILMKNERYSICNMKENKSVTYVVTEFQFDNCVLKTQTFAKRKQE